MTDDVARLGVEINAGSADVAAKQLDGVAAAGGRAEAQAKALAAAFADVSKRSGATADDYATLQKKIEGALLAQGGMTDATKAGAAATTTAATAILAGASAATDAATAINATGHAAVNARAATEALSAVHEIMQGRTSRLAGTMLILAQAMAGPEKSAGLLAAALSPPALAIEALVAATVGLGVMAVLGAEEIAKFNGSLIATGNYAGMTLSSLQELSQNIAAASDTTVLSSRKTTEALAETGKFSGDAIASLADAAQNYSSITHDSADKFAKEYEGMGQNLVEFAVKHEAVYHDLTLQQVDQINYLQKHGQEQSAQDQLAADIDAASKQRLAQTAQDAADKYGLIEAAMHGVIQTAAAMWDAMLGVGRPQTVDQQIVAAADDVKRVAAALKAASAPGSDYSQSTRDALQAQMNAALGKMQTLQVQAKADADKAAAAAAQTAQNHNAIQAKYGAGKTAAGPQDDTANKIAQLNSDIATAKVAELQAQLALTHDTAASGVIEQAIVAAQGQEKVTAIARQIAEVAKDKGLSDAAKADLTGKLQGVQATYQHVAAMNEQVQAEKTTAKLAAEALKSQTAGLQNQSDLLTAQGALAKNATDQGDIASKVLALQQQQAVIVQQAIVDSVTATTAEKADAQARLAILGLIQPLQTRHQAEVTQDAIAQEILRVQTASLQDHVGLLSSQSALGLSAYAQNQIALNILATQQQIQKIKLEEVVNSATASDADKQIAAATLATLPIVQANQTALAKRNGSLLNGFDEAATALGSMGQSIKSGDVGGALTNFGTALKDAAGLVGPNSPLSGVLGSLGKALGPVGGIISGVVSILGALFGNGNATIGVAHLSASDQQKLQGTGSVLGSLSEQSASIATSLAAAQKYQNTDLDYANQQVTYLKSISDNIGSLTAALGNQIGGIGGAFDTSKLGLGTTASKGFLGIIGASSTTTSLVDQGVNLGSGSLSAYIAGQVAANLYTDLQTVKTSSGFLGIGGGTTTTNTENTTAVDQDIQHQIALVVSSLKSGVLQAAGQIGVQGAQAVLDSVSVDLGRISLQGLSSDQITAQLNAVFSKLGDQLAADVAPQFKSLQQAGEGMLQTLERLATEYSTVDSSLAAIGATFGETGVDSVVARDSLVQLLGGLDTFVSETAYIQQNFLTAAQQLAPEQDAVTKAMSALGLASVTSKSQFVTLLQGIDLTTSGGQALYAQLLALAPAFGKVADAATALQSQARTLQEQLLQAQGDTAGYTAMQRQDTLAGLDPSLRPLQNAIYAYTDLATAQTNAATAAQNLATAQDTLTSAQDSLAQLQQQQADKVAQDALTVLNNASSAAQQAAQDAASALATATQGVTDASSALVAAYNKQQTALQATIDAVSTATQNLQTAYQAEMSTLNSNLSAAQQQVQAAQSALQTAYDAQVSTLNAQIAAVSTAQSNLQSAYQSELQTLQSALSAQQQAVQTATTAVQDALKTQAQAVTDAQSALQSAYNSQLQTLQANLQAQQQAVQTATQAIQSALSADASAVTSAQSALQSAYSSQLQTLQSNLQAQQQAVQTAQQAIQSGLTADASAVASAQSAVTSAYQSQTSALQQTISTFDQFTQSLTSFRQSLDSSSTALNPTQAFRSASAQFQSTSSAAAGGDQAALGNLQSVSQAYLDAAKAVAPSEQVYNEQLAAVKIAVDQAIAASQGGASGAQSQIDILNAQAGSLASINTGVQSLADAITALQAAQAQYASDQAAAAAVGVTATSDAAQTVAEAIGQLQSANAAAADAQAQINALEAQGASLGIVADTTQTIASALAQLQAAQAQYASDQSAASAAGVAEASTAAQTVASAIGQLQTAQAAATGAQAQIDALNAQVAGLGVVNSSVLSVADAISQLGAAQSAYADARAQAAAAGVTAASDTAQTVASAIGQLQSAQAAETDAQAQIDALNASVAGLVNVNGSTLSVADAISQLQTAQQAATSAQTQLDALNAQLAGLVTIGSATQGVADALTQLQTANQAEAVAQTAIDNLNAQVAGLIDTSGANTLSVTDAISQLLTAKDAATQAQSQLDAMTAQVGALVDLGDGVLSVQAAINNLMAAQGQQAAAQIAATQATTAASQAAAVALQAQNAYDQQQAAEQAASDAAQLASAQAAVAAAQAAVSLAQQQNDAAQAALNAAQQNANSAQAALNTSTPAATGTMLTLANGSQIAFTMNVPVSASSYLASEQATKRQAALSGADDNNVDFWNRFYDNNTDLVTRYASLVAGGETGGPLSTMNTDGEQPWQWVRDLYKAGNWSDRALYATGAAFMGQGVYQRPTAFNIGQMAEAGPEAIMPLTNIGGRLGVYAQNDNSVAQAIKELKAEFAQFRAENQAGQLPMVKALNSIDRRQKRWDGAGTPVRALDPAQPIQVQTV